MRVFERIPQRFSEEETFNKVVKLEDIFNAYHMYM